jgi:hypothetical protein
MTYDFHPEARLEYREAAVFYQACRPGLGAAFSMEVEATVMHLRRRPVTGASAYPTRTFNLLLKAYSVPVSDKLLYPLKHS